MTFPDTAAVSQVYKQTCEVVYLGRAVSGETATFAARWRGMCERPGHACGDIA